MTDRADAAPAAHRVTDRADTAAASVERDAGLYGEIVDTGVEDGVGRRPVDRPARRRRAQVPDPTASVTTRRRVVDGTALHALAERLAHHAGDGGDGEPVTPVTLVRRAALERAGVLRGAGDAAPPTLTVTDAVEPADGQPPDVDAGPVLRVAASGRPPWAAPSAGVGDGVRALELTLTFDPRVLDAEAAGRFLSDLAVRCEHPERFLA